jgi:hypothetical protein
MRALLYRLRRAGRRLAWAWLGAALLAGGAAGVYLGLVRPAGQDLAALERRVAGLRGQGAERAAGAAAREPGAQLARFQAQFPPRVSAVDGLQRIHAVAQANRLALMQGDYRFVAGVGGLARYQITLPLRGRYPDIRAFLAAVLAGLPTATLDKVSFDRPKIGDASVQATVRLSLFLREAP